MAPDCGQCTHCKVGFACQLLCVSQWRLQDFFGGRGIGIGRRSCVLSVKKYQLGLGREWADVRATGLLLYRYRPVSILSLFFFTGLAYKYSHLEGLYLSVGMVLYYPTLYLIVWSLSFLFACFLTLWPQPFISKNVFSSIYFYLSSWVNIGKLFSRKSIVILSIPPLFMCPDPS